MLTCMLTFVKFNILLDLAANARVDRRVLLYNKRGFLRSIMQEVLPVERLVHDAKRRGPVVRRSQLADSRRVAA